MLRRALLVLAALGGVAAAQQPTPLPPGVPETYRAFFEPAEPLKIVGPIHFVGTRDLGVYLIATRAGHVLIDGGMPTSGPLIEASIRKLGFKPEGLAKVLAKRVPAA